MGKKREKNSASVAQASHVARNIWGSLIVYWPYFAGTSFHDSRSPDEQMSFTLFTDFHAFQFKQLYIEKRGNNFVVPYRRAKEACD